MEIEKQRGISVASSVMQMLYRDHVINLLDTPGHKDFSEDTYRVLTAVDSALMVIDAANGVEAQTRAADRGLPPARHAHHHLRQQDGPRRCASRSDILDEVERELGMPCVPMTWPVGQGKAFGGIVNLRDASDDGVRVGQRARPQDFETVPLSEADALRAALRP